MPFICHGDVRYESIVLYEVLILICREAILRFSFEVIKLIVNLKESDGLISVQMCYSS